MMTTKQIREGLARHGFYLLIKPRDWRGVRFRYGSAPMPERGGGGCGFYRDRADAEKHITEMDFVESIRNA